MVRVVAVFVFCLLAACGEDPSIESASPVADTTERTDIGEGAEASTADSTREVDTTFSEDGDSRSDASEWSPAAVRVIRPVSDIPVVAALRAADHDGYDRFVVEFQRDEIPGYTIRYLNEPPHECGSGHPVEIPGAAVLELHLEPTRGYTEEGMPTVDHAVRPYGFEALRAADVSCDFEAVFTVVLGTAGRLPFRAVELSNPARLVIDVRHVGL